MLNLKVVSLSLLCVSLTVQAILMHVSRTNRAPGVPLYKPAAAVILTECGKLLISVLLAWRECKQALKNEAKPSLLFEADRSQPSTPSGKEKTSTADSKAARGEDEDQDEFEACEALLRQPASASDSFVPAGSEILQRMREDVFGPDWTKLSIPAMLFTGQSNLAYYASANLSVPVFQITYQLKVGCTRSIRCVKGKLNPDTHTDPGYSSVLGAHAPTYLVKAAVGFHRSAFVGGRHRAAGLIHCGCQIPRPLTRCWIRR